jgi:para-aminobenzoate synthetase component 1
MPESVFTVNPETTAEEIKKFVFSDERITAGFLSYDYGLDLKKIKSEKPRYMEEGRFSKYLAYAVHDDGLTIHCSNEQLFERLIFIAEGCFVKDFSHYKSELKANLTKKEYMDKVSEVLEKIRDGETYQLNLSIMYEADIDIDPVNLWKNMAERYPAPFYSYMNTASGAVISSSPERFIKVENGKALTQPIKGTLVFDEYYEGLEEKLTQSKKESAELSMIVDLMRNDLSEHCKVGSVEVVKHKDVFKVDKLLQMYSCIEGKLEDDKDVIDLLLGCFPGGSITGCPKKRSMEIIDNIEPHSRGIYCGSVFVIEDERNMDSSIAIRTGFYEGSMLKFFTGSGIVINSDPEKEYYETIGKAEKFFRIFE